MDERQRLVQIGLAVLAEWFDQVFERTETKWLWRSRRIGSWAARGWGEVGGSHRENGGRGSGSGHKLTESKGGGQEWHCGLCLMMHGVIFIVNEHTEARRKR